MDDQDVCKLCDFGVSRKISPNEKITEQCGTPAYLAPEIVRDKGYYGFKADVWSLGVLLFVLVTGKMPFRAATVDELNSAILDGKFEFPDDVDLSEDLKDLISKMLVVDVQKRISSKEVFQHKWCSLENEKIETSKEEPKNTENIFLDKNSQLKENFKKKKESQNRVNIGIKKKGGKFEDFLSRSIRRDLELIESAETYEHGQMAYLEQPKNRYNKFVLKRLEMIGFSLKNIMKSLNQKMQNHISACYYTLERDYL